jgi:hypothetical protein
MPSIEYRRRDLIVRVERTQTEVSFGRLQAQLSPVTDPAALAELIAASQMWKQWAALSNAMVADLLPRVCLEIPELDQAAIFWEKDLALTASQLAPGVLIVRTSPVWPRCANFGFRTPLRILRVNPDPSPKGFPGLEHQHRGKPLSQYEQAFVAADARWEELQPASIPKDWPNVDVLHIEAPLPLPQQAMSADAALRGSLGWFASCLYLWQVRLVVLQTSGGEDLRETRRFAAALLARGGPAMVVEAIPASCRDRFYSAFYRELIHDRPLDWMWRAALQHLAEPADGTLFVGASREEQLRISRMARHVPTATPPAKASAVKAPARKGAAREAMLKRKPKAKAAARKKPALAKHKAGLRDYSMRAPAEGGPVLHRFMTGQRLSAADLLDFRHESAFLSVSKQVLKLRMKAKPTITVEEALHPAPPKKKTARYCNACFWRESAKGRLLRVDQAKGQFRVGELYHLSIQIGAKDIRIITAREQAFAEEVIKWKPEMRGVWIEIGVTGIDFDVLGDPVQRLWLPREGPSEPVYFAVKPRRAGPCRLRFSLYYEQNVIQSFRVAAIVDAKPGRNRAKLAAVLGLKPSETPDVAWLPKLEFSLAPSLERFAAGTDPLPERRALSIVTNDWAGQCVITVKGAAAFAVNVSADRLPLQVKDLREVLVNLSGFPESYPFDGATNVGGEEQLRRMVRLLADEGSKLFLELIDAPAWQPLLSCLEEPGQVIQVAQTIREKVIPWTFVYGRDLMPRPGDRDKDGKLVNMPVCLAGLPNAQGKLTITKCGTSPQCLQNSQGLAPENVICPMHFWGYRHIIEIPPQQVPAKTEESDELPGVRTQIPVIGKARVVAGLNATFDAEQGHMIKVGGIAGKIPFAKEEVFTRAVLLERLATSPIHLAYFFCHASGGKGNSDSMVILQAPGAAEGERIPWQDFARLLKGKMWQPPALVFLNGCRTAAYSPEALSPFLRAFVDQLGASGLIATEISVWDVFAAEMAEKFLAEFFNCEPAGAALLTARRAMLAKRNPFGLIYDLFAWSKLRLVTSE